MTARRIAEDAGDCFETLGHVGLDAIRPHFRVIMAINKSGHLFVLLSKYCARKRSSGNRPIEGDQRGCCDWTLVQSRAIRRGMPLSGVAGCAPGGDVSKSIHAGAGRSITVLADLQFSYRSHRSPRIANCCDNRIPITGPGETPNGNTSQPMRATAYDIQPLCLPWRALVNGGCHG